MAWNFQANIGENQLGFYDSYDLSGFTLFQHIQKYDMVSEPCSEFIDAIIDKKRQSHKPIAITEVGIGYGASTLLASTILDKGDEYYCFDFNHILTALAEDLQKLTDIHCDFVLMGNTNKTFDSYNWALSNLVLHMKSENLDGMFDVAYLDGAHLFPQDGLAICLLKILMKREGILILDDLFLKTTDSEYWTEYHSKNFTMEQMEDMQVLRAQKIFLENDPNFEQLSKPDSSRGVFSRKI